jgi:hypothetical protein
MHFRNGAKWHVAQGSACATGTLLCRLRLQVLGQAFSESVVLPVPFLGDYGFQSPAKAPLVSQGAGTD